MSGFTYDANGNPTQYNGTSLTFDANNQATTIGSALTAFSDVNGRRAYKGSAAAQTYYIYDGDQPIMEIGSNGATTALNTFGPTGLVSRNSAGSSVFYQFDQSGNTTERLDSSGNVLSAHGCDSFGGPLVSPTSSDPFDGFGAQLGYYTDHETGLELLGHRYYDPGFGRFLNRDPLGQTAGLNQYRYAGNSPLNAWDPSGLCSGGRQDTSLLGGLTHWLMSSLEDSPINPMWAYNAARKGYNQVGQFGSDLGYAWYGHTPTAYANLSRDAGNALMAADGPLGEVGEAGLAGAETASRGLSDLGGVIDSQPTAAGGTVWLADGDICQNDFSSIVNSALMQGNEVNIITGVHGTPLGNVANDPAMYQFDAATFGGQPGINVHNFPDMSDAQIGQIVNGSGTVVGGFCNSRWVLGPYIE